MIIRSVFLRTGTAETTPRAGFIHSIHLLATIEHAIMDDEGTIIVARARLGMGYPMQRLQVHTDCP
jgi:hypothetical protein